jgi:hypothetical protein
MLAARLRLNILKDIADIPLENTSADDFAARFLAIVARQVPEEAQATRDAYEAAVPVDAAAFGALSKDALDKLVGTYLAAEAKSMVVKSRQSDGAINALPGERESERLLRLVKTTTDDLKATMQDAARTLQQHFAQLKIPDNLGVSLDYIAQRTQALAALFEKVQVPNFRLPEIKLPDYSAQYTAAVQAMTAIGRQQVELAESWRGMLARLQPIAEQFSKQFIDTARAVHESFQARLAVYPKLAEKILPLAQRGWFMSEYFGLSEIDQLAHAATTPSLDELERCIAKLYEENFTIHLQDIIRDYPEREFVLRPAGDAHLRGEYALSVMAFFAQVDGICSHAIGREVFRGGDKHISFLAAIKLETNERGNEGNSYGQFFGLLHEIMWLSVSGKLPMGYSENQRRHHNYDGINRHTVLHGIAMKEYATQENSLKTFSFLSYMASLAKLGGERNAA